MVFKPAFESHNLGVTDLGIITTWLRDKVIV